MKPTRSLAKLLQSKGRVEAPKAPPRDQQIFKCPQCENFARLPTECKRCKKCRTCCVCDGPRVEEPTFKDEPGAEPPKPKPKLPV